MEEGRRIGVVAIDLVPESGPFACLEVARKQRCLACARGCVNPHRRVTTYVVQEREQAFASSGIRYPRTRDLGYGCESRLRHRTAPSACPAGHTTSEGPQTEGSGCGTRSRGRQRAARRYVRSEPLEIRIDDAKRRRRAPHSDLTYRRKRRPKVQCPTRCRRCTFFVGEKSGGRLGAARRRPPAKSRNNGRPARRYASAAVLRAARRSAIRNAWRHPKRASRDTGRRCRAPRARSASARGNPATCRDARTHFR